MKYCHKRIFLQCPLSIRKLVFYFLINKKAQTSLLSRKRAIWSAFGYSSNFRYIMNAISKTNISSGPGRYLQYIKIQRECQGFIHNGIFQQFSYIKEVIWWVGEATDTQNCPTKTGKSKFGILFFHKTCQMWQKSLHQGPVCLPCWTGEVKTSPLKICLINMLN